MRVLSLVAVLAILPAAAHAAAIDHEIRFDPEGVIAHWRGDTVEVSLRGGLRDFTPGRPDLPLHAERVDLPPGMRVRAVTVTGIERRPLAARATFLPTFQIRREGEPPERTRPDPLPAPKPLPPVSVRPHGVTSR